MVEDRIQREELDKIIETHQQELTNALDDGVI